MKIFLIRHGETIANIGDNYISRIPDQLVPLTENGILQANAAGEWLADYCARKNISFKNACIWRSPYLRARQTSDQFNKYLCIDNVREDVTLVEQQYGLFDAIPEKEWESRFPVEYAECKRQWDNAGKFYLRLPNGESPFDVALRVRQFIGTIKRDSADTLFVFTHGTALRCFLLRWFYYQPEWFEKEKNPKNCWIRLIDDELDMGYIYNE